MSTSATRHAITWTFDTDYTVGTFANGDPYVVENSAGAGVRIIAITGADTASAVYNSGGIIRIKNGSMANPSAKEFAQHGFDSYLDVDYVNGGKYAAYLAAYNVARPIRASGTNLVIDGSDTTKVTSASYTFDSADVGQVIQQSVNTGGWSSGLYVVSSVSGGAAFLDRAPGTAGLTGGNWKLDSELSGANYYAAPANTSIVSALSRAWTTPTTANNRPTLSDASVLTVLASAPAAGSFRPPYCSTTKTIWNKSSLDYSILKKYTVTGSPTDLIAHAATMDRVWIEIGTGTDGRSFHPTNNQYAYGRDMANIGNGNIIALHSNFSDAVKEPLYIRVVQYGIDVYGAAVSGSGNMWGNTGGGFNMGRKPALVLAALALNDSNIAWYAEPANYFKFAEDTSHWFVTEADVGRALITSGSASIGPYPHQEYTVDQVGMAEWGLNHVFNPPQDSANWGQGYRNVNFQPNLRGALGVRLITGGEALWNWPSFFAYHERVWSIEGASWASNWDEFTKNMWVTYSGYTPPADTTPPTPSPSTWATAPHASGDGIAGVSTATTDADSPPVLPYFSVVPTGDAPDYILATDAALVRTGLAPSTAYDVQVRWQDSSGNYTDASTIVTVTTNAPDPRSRRSPRGRGMPY